MSRGPGMGQVWHDEAILWRGVPLVTFTPRVPVPAAFLTNRLSCSPPPTLLPEPDYHVDPDDITLQKTMTRAGGGRWRPSIGDFKMPELPGLAEIHDSFTSIQKQLVAQLPVGIDLSGLELVFGENDASGLPTSVGWSTDSIQRSFDAQRARIREIMQMTEDDDVE